MNYTTKFLKNIIASRYSRSILAVLLVVGLNIISFAEASYAGLVIRGGTCSANAFEKGADGTNNDGYIYGLSVNYTNETSKKVDFEKYRPLTEKGELYKQYCVATSDQIKNKGGKLTPAPIPGNDLHYLLDGKAKDIAKVLTKYPL